MTLLRTSLIGAIIIAGVAAALLLHHHAQVQLQRREVAGRQQAHQFAELTEESQRLSNLLAQAATVPAETPTDELQRLRREAAGLRQRTNELAKNLEAGVRHQRTQSSSGPESRTPEYYLQLHKMSAGNVQDAKTLGLAFATYAADHNGQFPASFDQVASYFRQQHLTLTGTNQFDIVFQGSPAQLRVPRGAVAVLRDRQVWQGPDGKTNRVYTMADGSVQTVQSDDNFQAWEAEHILAPKATGQ